MTEGEEFEVIELDQGDGWTRVRRKATNAEGQFEEGFVPTSYIETQLFESATTNGASVPQTTEATS